MTTKTITGGCQCGAVRYRVDVVLSNPHLCHCRMCQKAAGNYFMPLAWAPREKVVMTRGRPAWFHSSDIVRRGFCQKCGTPLFFDAVATSHMLVTLGSLDDPSRYRPVSEDSVESRLPFVAPWPDLHQKITDDDFTAEEMETIRASNHQHPDHDTETWPPEDK
ncbi:GFA family protein [Nitratireductor sp. CAU 1489]|uniref:GFA family protein n=1 Tax=Nitratireductor arenosus TaxID=2682096 RepID=A0A844QM51_9HYPH|nr:GFA family protein [Nitratireductor arenosus]MVA99654.1 GFA family protein [Nitratireductor arenosus]